jgi:hypothetical protein
MQCPTDAATLVMSERSGIEIDYSPDCRGVWLDRGELDKIIERSVTQPDAAAVRTAEPAAAGLPATGPPAGLPQAEARGVLAQRAVRLSAKIPHGPTSVT